MNSYLTESNQNTPQNAVTAIESSRAVQEVQAAMVVAKRFPRDIDLAFTRIMKACERPLLAKCANYAYPRGGQMVTGPSIRLAETIAQNWGNLDFGIRELSQVNGESEVEAYCWDMETNVRQTKTFTVPHKRHTRKGSYDLKDPRDIYETVASNGARRLRACILGVIPGDIIDAAVEKCDQTLKAGGDGKTLEDRIRQMLTTFEKVGVSKEMIESRLGHKTTAIVESQMVDLGKIFNSIKDGMSKREDWFTITGAVSEESKDLTDKINKKSDIPEDVQKEIDNFESMDAFVWLEAKKKTKIEPKTIEEVSQVGKVFNEILDKKNA